MSASGPEQHETARRLTEEVRRAVADAPYTVTDETDDGFTLQIDVVDRQWWTLMKRKSLAVTYRHEVRVHPTRGTYTVTDVGTRVAWEAGLDVAGGVPRPVLRGTAGITKGTFRTLELRKELGVDDTGTPGTVVDYTFSSNEGNRYVDDAAARLGLRKRMNPTALVGLGFAAVGVLGALVALVVLLATGRIG